MEFLWCYNPSKIIKYCILHDEPWRSPFRFSLLSVTTSQLLAYSGYFFGKQSRVLFDTNLYLLLVVHVHMKLKKCQWIIRTLTCKHNIWGENWLCLRPYLKAFPVFNVLATCREYFLTIDLEIVEFIKKFIERFLEKCETFRPGPDYLQKLYQKQLNQVNKILLTRDRPEQFPSFFCMQFSMESNHCKMKPHSQSLSFS